MSLKKYVIRRILQLIVTYWGFLTLLFVIFRVGPGDPATLYLQHGLSPAERDEMLARYGLDQPLHYQYFDYMGMLLSGDLGDSYRYGVPVEEIIWVRFWNTIFLMGAAIILAYIIGIFFGAYIGWLRGTVKEKTGMVVALIARSSPEFWTGMILLIIFTWWLGWFPAGGMGTEGREIEHFYQRYVATEFVYHMVLPVMAATIYYLAAPTLLMRTNMVQILDSDFINVKKAEGLPNRTILFKHAARNSVLPVITVFAYVVGFAMGGSLVIETIFNWPGMGREMVDSVSHQDYNVAQAVFFLMGSFVILMNFVADLVYIWADPRVTYE